MRDLSDELEPSSDNQGPLNIAARPALRHAAVIVGWEPRNIN
jgi:hypothetical protein